MQTANNNPLIEIAVRNLSGQTWSEQWSKEKLAYFILMCDLDDPKFERSLDTEWVGFDTNLYSWNKGALSRQEFESFRDQWPGKYPVPFDSNSCDRVQFSYRSPRGTVGVGFAPANEPELYNALLRIAAGHIEYETFDYANARHVFVLEIDSGTFTRLLRNETGASNSLRRIDSELFAAISSDTIGNIEARFLTRHGSFEVPISLWFEG